MFIPIEMSSEHKSDLLLLNFNESEKCVLMVEWLNAGMVEWMVMLARKTSGTKTLVKLYGLALCVMT